MMLRALSRSLAGGAVGVLLFHAAATGAASPSSEGEAVPVASDVSSYTQSRIPLADPKAGDAGNTNLGRLLAQAKAMGPASADFARLMVHDIEVPPLERELICLAVLHLERGAYEWHQHMRVLELMGFPKSKVDAIAQDRFGDPVFNARERALLAFTRQVVTAVRVDDATFASVSAFYSPRQIVESVLVIGNYMMLVRVSEVAQLPLDPTTDGANFWKSQEAHK
jgi:alkylhydroperoxidase family enzyme